MNRWDLSVLLICIIHITHNFMQTSLFYQRKSFLIFHVNCNRNYSKLVSQIRKTFSNLHIFFRPFFKRVSALVQRSSRFFLSKRSSTRSRLLLLRSDCARFLRTSSTPLVWDKAFGKLARSTCPRLFRSRSYDLELLPRSPQSKDLISLQFRLNLLGVMSEKIRFVLCFNYFYEKLFLNLSHSFFFAN